MALDRDSLLNSANATFIAELYGRYLNDPRSVDSSWADFFKDLDDDSRTLLLDSRGASWAPRDAAVIGAKINGAAAPAAAKGGVSADALRAACLDSILARILIRSYRARGHLEAALDPLGLEAKQEHPELHPRTLGFTDADYDRPIFVFDAVGVETATLRELIARLRAAYCGTIGIEYMHMQDPEQKDWIQERAEAAPY